MTTTTKPKPPPPKKNGAAPAPAPSPNGGVNLEEPVEISEGPMVRPQRIVLYSSGGLGKTTLASLMPGRTLFLDVEKGSAHLNVRRMDKFRDFAHLRVVLTSSALDAYDNIVVDSVTKVEALAVTHTLEHVRNDKGLRVASVEDYGWGRGPGYVFDTFEGFMFDLDSLVLRGKNVVLIAHDCTANVPNPAGEDWIRFEPRLQNPKSGKASIQARVVEWADHVFFIAMDVHAEKGKGMGSGTRTIYPCERPSWIAKSRSITDPIPFAGPDDAALWTLVFPPQPIESETTT